jgi:hypothetical protein
MRLVRYGVEESAIIKALGPVELEARGIGNSSGSSDSAESSLGSRKAE